MSADRRAYFQQYFQENKERLRPIRATYREKHKPSLKAYAARWWAAHKDRLNLAKKAKRCGVKLITQ